MESEGEQPASSGAVSKAGREPGQCRNLAEGSQATPHGAWQGGRILAEFIALALLRVMRRVWFASLRGAKVGRGWAA